MSALYDFRVLDAIGNSLQGRQYSVGDPTRREEVFGIEWLTLQEITGLCDHDLVQAVTTLYQRGLIGQGGPSGFTLNQAWASHRPLYLWATGEGRRVLDRLSFCP